MSRIGELLQKPLCRLFRGTPHGDDSEPGRPQFVGGDEILAVLGRLHRINEKREALLRAQILDGVKLDLELGSGGGGFAARLSEASGLWVIGINKALPSSFIPGREDSYGLTLPQYEAAARFLLVCGSYSAVLARRARFLWLEGAVRRTFLIMPDHERGELGFAEELELWQRYSMPGGELHVRTDIEGVLDKMNITAPHEIIPFAADADQIDSDATVIIRGQRKPIYSFGIRLLVAEVAT